MIWHGQQKFVKRHTMQCLVLAMYTDSFTWIALTMKLIFVGWQIKIQGSQMAKMPK